MVIKRNANNKKASKPLLKIFNKDSKAIAKKIQKENPRRPPVASRLKPKEISNKKYYTIEEDAIILWVLSEEKYKRTKGVSIIKVIKQKVGKTEESIRNRVKRYLRRLS